VEAAKRAFNRNSKWRTMNPYVRGQLMHKVRFYDNLFIAFYNLNA